MEVLVAGYRYKVANFEQDSDPHTPSGILIDLQTIHGLMRQLLPACKESTQALDLMEKVRVLLGETEDANAQVIQFVHKEQKSEVSEDRKSVSSERVTVSNGTTNEELLAVLINRAKFLNEKFPCRENALAITKMQEALFWFNERTRDRQARNVEGKYEK